MAIEKWKSYPCKECIIKNTCSKACFEYPDDNSPIQFSKEELVRLGYNTCITCTTKIAEYKIWCQTCFVLHI